jgi:hypothetical protein
MKWFRSNIRLGSRLALLALAIQFLLSFGHSHGGGALAASVSAGVKRPALHSTTGVAAAHLDALDAASLANTSTTEGLKSCFGDRPDDQPSDDCAICAVMALASTMLDATPPHVLGPQAGAFLRLTVGSGFVDPDRARVAFQPRGPPIA